MAWSELYEIPLLHIPYDMHLHGFSDLQIGSESSSSKLIQFRIKEICDDPVDSGVVILGDIEDEDRPSTRAIRKSAFADRDEVIERDAQKHMAWLDKTIIPMLLPLQKTKYGIMGVLAGHHWTQLSPVLNSVQYICMEISRLSKRPVPYLGIMSAFIDLRFRTRESGSIRKVVHIQHGEGGGQTKTAALLKLDRTSQGFIADAFIRAHDCQIVASKIDQLYPKEVKNKGSVPDLMAKTIALLNLGSATRGYDFNKGRPSYIEDKMMRPTTMGWGTLIFKVRKARAFEDPWQSNKVDIRVEI